MRVETPYCTLLDVQKETKNSKPENTVHYERCIGLASRMVDEHCRRDFGFHDHSTDETLLAVPRSWVMPEDIHLPWPIIELAGVWQVADRKVGQVPSDLWDEHDYFFDVGGQTITADMPKVFSSDYPYKGLTLLKGKFGYAVASPTEVPAGIPATIRRFTAVIAATISVERRLEQTNLEGNRIELVELNIPSDVFRQLSRFRNFSYMI